MTDETKDTEQADDQVPESTAHEPSVGEGGEPSPPDDVENDPAYNPDDPGLQGLKGG
jgi:hypothetical protein